MRILGLIPPFLSMTKPNSFVMIDMPGSGLGKRPSVLVSNSDSVAGSTSHDAVVEVAGASPGAAVVSVVTLGAVFARTVTAAEAALAVELPAALIATVVNVYAVPAVKPSIVQEPDAPVTVQVLPPGEAVAMYDVGAMPELGAVTVMVALSSPATTVATPGVAGTLATASDRLFTDEGPNFGVILPSRLWIGSEVPASEYSMVTTAPENILFVSVSVMM